MIIHPAQNVIEPCNAAVGAANAREAVGFLGEANEFCFHASAFEGHKGLLALLNGTAMVMLVVDDECGSFGFTQIFDRRHIP